MSGAMHFVDPMMSIPPLQEGLNSFSIDVMGERRFFDERNSDGWEGFIF